MTYAFDTYQREAGAFAAPLTADTALANAALGLTGEAAEVLDAVLRLIVSAGKTSERVKKHLAQGHELDRDKIAAEIGDVQWYAARLCELLHLSLGDVAQGNIAKLRARFGARFSASASINRDEPTTPDIPSTKRSGEMAAVVEPFTYAGPGTYRRRGMPPIQVHPIPPQRMRDDGFAYIGQEGTRYTLTGHYLSDKAPHPADLVGGRVES